MATTMGRRRFFIFTLTVFAFVLNFAKAGDCEDEVICEKVVPQLESLSTQFDQFPRQLEEALAKLSGSVDNAITERTTRLENMLDNLASEMNGFSKILQHLVEKLESRDLPAEKDTANQSATSNNGNTENLTLENAQQSPETPSTEIKAKFDDYEIFPEATIDATALFATGKHYSDARMVTNQTNALPSQEFPQHLTKDEVHADCCHSCWKQENCHAFNLIVKNDSYVCEYLTDNYCFNTTSNALLNCPGSTLWEKIGTTKEETCLDAQFPSGQEIPCEAVRPGCLGTWPQCTNCSNTCKDVFLKHGHVVGDYTLWPEGDGPFMTPIFGFCSSHITFLVNREVNMTTGELVKDYRMPLYDMHRIARLGAYNQIIFRFVSTNGSFYEAHYRNWFIDENGTLMNMTYNIYFSRISDLFNLKRKPMKPTPFVTVTDDRYGCGSFWLVDANNATYCPGGKVGMFGKIQVDNGTVVSTGMTVPAAEEDEKIKFAGIFLKL